jgi:hypothetical protein
VAGGGADRRDAGQALEALDCGRTAAARRHRWLALHGVRATLDAVLHEATASNCCGRWWPIRRTRGGDAPKRARRIIQKACAEARLSGALLLLLLVLDRQVAETLRIVRQFFVLLGKYSPSHLAS